MYKGSDLRALREGLGLSIYRIAPSLGVNRRTWAGYEITKSKELPLTLRLALAAWTRGLPAMGDTAPVMPADLKRKPRKEPPKQSGLAKFFRRK